MPYTDQGLPFSGKTLTSRHCSERSAVSAGETRVWKAERYRQYLQRVGLASDHKAAADLRWPLSSINSIRNGLVDKGMVEAAGTIMGAHSKRVTLWRLVLVTAAMCEGDE